MADLIEQFFTRDLSEAEHEALGKLLQESPEAAAKYESLLEQNYLATGLPKPTLPNSLNYIPKGSGSLLGKGALLKVLAAGLAVVTAGMAWKFWPKAEIPVSIQQPVAQQIPQKRSIPVVLQRKLVPVKPLAAGPAQEGQQLSVV